MFRLSIVLRCLCNRKIDVNGTKHTCSGLCFLMMVLLLFLSLPTRETTRLIFEDRCQSLVESAIISRSSSFTCCEIELFSSQTLFMTLPIFTHAQWPYDQSLFTVLFKTLGNSISSITFCINHSFFFFFKFKTDLCR